MAGTTVVCQVAREHLSCAKVTVHSPHPHNGGHKAPNSLDARTQRDRRHDYTFQVQMRSSDLEWQVGLHIIGDDA